MDNENLSPPQRNSPSEDRQRLAESAAPPGANPRDPSADPNARPDASSEGAPPTLDPRPVRPILTTNVTGESNRDELNLFERFMDVFTAGNRPSLASLEHPLESPTTAMGSASARDTPNSTGSTTTNAATAETNHTGGAIIITVSYVFSDENNPQLPNRSGSLVMSLPNTPANRDPSTIQEIISLATQMAYLTIVSGFKKAQGITLEKFESFPVRSLDTVSGRSCSICFEDYEEPKVVVEKADEDGDCASASGSSKEDHSDGPRRKKRKVVEAGDNADANADASTSPDGDNADASTASSNDTGAGSVTVKYLSDYTGSFPHAPVEMPCGHIFGKNCLCEWLRDHTTCPLCRDSVAEPVAQTADGPSVTTNTSQTFTNLLNLRYPPRLPLGGNESGSTSPVAAARGSTGGAGGFQSTARRGTSAYSSLNRIDSMGPVRHTPPNVLPSGVRRGDEGVLSQLFAFLRRPPASHESLFPTGVSSRRGADGVVTTSSERDTNEIIDYLNLRSLTDDADGSSSGATSGANDAPSNNSGSSADANSTNSTGNESGNGDEAER